MFFRFSHQRQGCQAYLSALLRRPINQRHMGLLKLVSNRLSLSTWEGGNPQNTKIILVQRDSLGRRRPIRTMGQGRSRSQELESEAIEEPPYKYGFWIGCGLPRLHQSQVRTSSKPKTLTILSPTVKPKESVPICLRRTQREKEPRQKWKQPATRRSTVTILKEPILPKLMSYSYRFSRCSSKSKSVKTLPSSSVTWWMLASSSRKAKAPLWPRGKAPKTSSHWIQAISRITRPELPCGLFNHRSVVISLMGLCSATDVLLI